MKKEYSRGEAICEKCGEIIAHSTQHDGPLQICAGCRYEMDRTHELLVELDGESCEDD